MQLEYAKNPVWANEDHTIINLTIKWDEIDQELPFSASPDDCEEHGRAIFTAAQSGDYGPVAEFIPYIPTEEELAGGARYERDLLLAETDWTQLPDVSESLRQKWAEYRQALRDVPQQAGFPTEITWPVKPE